LNFEGMAEQDMKKMLALVSMAGQGVKNVVF
jgi:hypothetical protein